MNLIIVLPGHLLFLILCLLFHGLLLVFHGLFGGVVAFVWVLFLPGKVLQKHHSKGFKQHQNHPGPKVPQDPGFP